MKDKICSIFGHKEADPERGAELEKLLRDLITKKDVTYFVISEINKFSFQCYQILKKLKGEFDNIKIAYAFTYTNEEYNKNIINQFDFDEFFPRDLSLSVYTIFSIIEKSDVVLVQYFKTLRDKDHIIEDAIILRKELIKF